MSLINEALKRTRDAAFKSGANRSNATDGYRVGNGSPASAVSSRTSIWATLVIAVITLSLGAVFATRFIRNARSINDGFADIVTSSNTTAAVPVAPQEPATTQSPATEIDTKTADDKLVAKVVEKLKAEQVVAAEAQPAKAPSAPRPEPPKLVLQGITSDGAAREAMINGINLREGDDIEGARVVSIEPHRVKLQFDQHDIVLRMP